MKKLNNKSYAISSLFMIIELILIIYEIYSKYNLNLIEEKKIEYYFKINDIHSVDNKIEMQQLNIDETNNYIAVLEIPKINLKKGLSPINNYNNNVDRNIEILKESNMPDIQNGNFILAGHSGIGQTAYFKNLYKLNVGDEINIYYNNIKYVYKLIKIYGVEKTGKVSIKRNKNKITLTMITCDFNSNKQIVYISELIDN